MSIQRYTEEPFAAFVKNDDGDFVKYSDHEAELHNLLSTLADIRTALGVGDKPMLSELAGIVRTRMGVIKILERDAKEAQVTLARVTKELYEALEKRCRFNLSLGHCRKVQCLTCSASIALRAARGEK